MINTATATEQNITTEKTKQINDTNIHQSTDSESNIELAETNYKNINKQEKTKNEKGINAKITDKKDTTISIDSLKYGKYGENVSISGKLTDDNNNGISNTKINITLNNVNYSKKTDNKGIYVFSTKITKIGENTITVRFNGNTKYNADEKKLTFNVEKQDTIITYKKISRVSKGDNVTITGKLTDKNKKAMKSSNVNIYINGKRYKTKTDNNGTYTLNTAVKKTGTNNVTISYGGNNYYNGYETNTTFIYDKQGTIISYEPIDDIIEGNKVTITGKLTEETGKALTNRNINIYINGKKNIVKTDSNGIYTFTIVANKLGTNKVTLSYAGNSYYQSYKTNTTFDVLEKIDPDIRLAGSEIHPGKVKAFFALFPYDAAGKVTLKIDRTVIGKNIPVEDGQIWYPYLIPESYHSDYYTLYLNYSGDSTYKGKLMNVTLTLTPEGGKVNATMNLDNFTVKYSSKENLTVTLDDDAFGTILYEINGTNISKSVKFTNGTCNYKYTAKLDPGEYLLIATYSGNYKYKPQSVNSTLTIIKLNSEITVQNVSAKAGNITLFSAKVVDELGKAVKGMTVEFRLNNTFIGSNTTNKNGVVKLYYRLPSSLYEKKYTINVIGNDTATVLGSTSHGTLKLLQLKTRVLVPNISTIPAKYTTITATIVDEFNNPVTKGKVTFKKDRKTIATVDVDNGYAKYQYESNYETATLSYIYASYVGDWKYANSKGNGTYKVTKLKTTITTSSLEAKPNSEIIITARLMDETQNAVTQGNVTFTLGNKVLGTVIVSKGNAKIRYTLDGYKVGDYRIKSEYHGSQIYKACSGTSILTVTRYETNMKGDSINAVVGNTTSITLNVIDEEKYNVDRGTVKYYINSEYIGSANVTNGYATLEYFVPSKYDGKTVKYYATYVKNDLYESSSYSDTMVVSHQKIVYVSPTGSDSNLGDKDHPFKTIEYAINHITLFGTVILDEGTYNAYGIKINSSISIIGSGRDKTIINGLNKGQPIFNMSRRNVVLTLDGVTIKNGKSTTEFSAGAIVTSGKLTITNCRFANNTGSGNYSGGAIYTNGILNVTNTEFINNVVTNINSQGGAIRTYENITYITNCTFDSNKVTGSNSTGGSVIYSDSGDIIINGTIFNKNSVTGKYVTGGVIRSIYGAVVIDNSTFTNNKIKATDYGIGGIIGSISSGVSILNSRFTSNTIEATNSAGGDVAYVETAVLEMKNSQASSNTVTSKETYGGVIYGFKAFITLNNDTFEYNKMNATTNGYGAVLYIYEGNLSIDKTKFTNNTLRANDMALAGVLYAYSDVLISNSDLISNNINATNLGGGAIANMGNMTITHTNLIDNYAYDAGNAITATATAVNNIEGNYWGSDNPSWDVLLNSVKIPSTYSKTKIKN